MWQNQKQTCFQFEINQTLSFQIIQNGKHTFIIAEHFKAYKTILINFKWYKTLFQTLVKPQQSKHNFIEIYILVGM